MNVIIFTTNIKIHLKGKKNQPWQPVYLWYVGMYNGVCTAKLNSIYRTLKWTTEFGSSGDCLPVQQACFTVFFVTELIAPKVCTFFFCFLLFILFLLVAYSKCLLFNLSYQTFFSPFIKKVQMSYKRLLIKLRITLGKGLISPCLLMYYTTDH